MAVVAKRRGRVGPREAHPAPAGELGDEGRGDERVRVRQASPAVDVEQKRRATRGGGLVLLEVLGLVLSAAATDDEGLAGVGVGGADLLEVSQLELLEVGARDVADDARVRRDLELRIRGSAGQHARAPPAAGRALPVHHLAIVRGAASIDEQRNVAALGRVVAVRVALDGYNGRLARAVSRDRLPRAPRGSDRLQEQVARDDRHRRRRVHLDGRVGRQQRPPEEARERDLVAVGAVADDAFRAVAHASQEASRELTGDDTVQVGPRDHTEEPVAASDGPVASEHCKRARRRSHEPRASRVRKQVEQRVAAHPLLRGRDLRRASNLTHSARGLVMRQRQPLLIAHAGRGECGRVRAHCVAERASREAHARVGRVRKSVGDAGRVLVVGREIDERRRARCVAVGSRRQHRKQPRGRLDEVLRPRHLAVGVLPVRAAADVDHGHDVARSEVRAEDGRRREGRRGREARALRVAAAAARALCKPSLEIRADALAEAQHATGDRARPALGRAHCAVAHAARQQRMQRRRRHVQRRAAQRG
mmetsp:Transcript_12738/g.40636  ORF Transcript_12738/g.40636 Transcript_12738/m.40636 type:complete len:536 (+) Transcript_12738:1318-2925(+)